MSEERTHVTQALVDRSRGDPNAVAELLPLVYAKLRSLAARYMRSERVDHTLQPARGRNTIRRLHTRITEQDQP